MALLNEANVLYYHPCDDEVEYVQGFLWNNTTGQFVPSGLISIGFTFSGTNILARLTSPVDNDYADLNGLSGITVLVWTSGLWIGSTESDHNVRIGTGGDNFPVDNGVVIGRDGNNNRIVARIGGASTNLSVTPPVSSGWTLTVVDLRKTTATNWKTRVSFNGSGYTDLGDFTNASNFGSDLRAKFSLLRNSSSVPKIVVDEVVLWRDNTLFSSEELSNLYELYNTYGLSMDFYTLQFNNVSDEINLYVPGQVETDDIDLFVEGLGLITDDIDLFVEGVETETDDIDLFVQNNFVEDSLDLYLHNTAIDDQIDLYVQNNILEDQIDLFLGNYVASGGINFFMHGAQINQFNIFVRAEDQLIDDQINLFVNGIPSGTSGNIFLTSDSINFHTISIEQLEPVSGTFGVFAKVEAPSLVGVSGQWNIFVAAGNTSEVSIDLFVHAHASGAEVNGIQGTNDIDLFIEGDGDPFNEDFIFTSGSFSVFARVNDGVIDDIDLYVSGFMYPSGTMDMFVYGITDYITDSVDLFINSHEGNIVDNINLYTFGVLNTIADAINLFTFTDVGIETDNLMLYTHGF